SSSDAWLSAFAAPPVREELHESGIVYFSRFYRVRAGVEAPPYVGPTAADLGYLKYAIFLGDNRTFSITYAIESHDEEMRRALAAPDGFETVARSLVATAPWRVDGVADPITDVHAMAGLRNRYRPLVDGDGEPLVHGFVAGRVPGVPALVQLVGHARRAHGRSRDRRRGSRRLRGPGEPPRAAGARPRPGAFDARPLSRPEGRVDRVRCRRPEGGSRSRAT